MQPISGTSPTATSSSDTLTFSSSDSSISIAGNSGTKTLDFKLAAGSEYNAGNSSTAITIDFSNGPTQVVTLTGNATISFTNIAAATAYILRVKTGAGGFTATFSGLDFGTAGAPTITTTATKYDLIYIYGADGTKVSATYAQGFGA